MMIYQEQVMEIAREWETAPIDFAAARRHLPKSIAIFSTNDQYVSLDNRESFRGKFGSEIITMENMGHFTDMTKLPQVLDAVLKISAEKI